jgi:ribosomal protein S18 acetylase RimI-like enzyme
LKRVSIVEIELENRSQFLEYLLLADESEEVVKTYLFEGEMYGIHYEEQLVGVVLFTFPQNNVVELKNIALSPKYQGMGFGRVIINDALTRYKHKGFQKMIVGTANSSIANLAFYQKVGFRMVEIKKNFFVDYPEPIIENGIRAIDMVMFEKELTN